MWQTKRSLLNILTHTLTFPVNLEGRQGGHLCCGGSAARRYSFHHYSHKPSSEMQSCLTASRRLREDKNNKQWKIRESERRGTSSAFVSGCVFLCVWLWILHTNGHVDFCDLRGAILETLWSKRYAARQAGRCTDRLVGWGEKQLNTLTNLIWLTT